ncbi:MAG: protease complex subunit PrcB family protein [Euryarchaeota archaeon]|nr:protease complex subunit PrcB family protein [Euryarchaeota archaeon]
MLLLSGCAGGPEAGAGESPANLTPLVDYHFLGGYTGRAGEGFYVIAGDVEQVREELIRILGGEPPRERFSSAESLNLVVFRGVFPTGGYGLKIEAVEREGNRFVVRAVFTDPPLGAAVTQAFTQPTAVVPLGRLPPGEYSAELYVRRDGEVRPPSRVDFAVE